MKRPAAKVTILALDEQFSKYSSLFVFIYGNKKPSDHNSHWVFSFYALLDAYWIRKVSRALELS